eukprot:3944076-Amphidinium_carterae.1
MRTPFPTTAHEQVRKGASLGALPLPSTQRVSCSRSRAWTSGQTWNCRRGAGTKPWHIKQGGSPGWSPKPASRLAASHAGHSYRRWCRLPA